MNEPEATPNMEKQCPQCGAPLPSGGLAGLCPACLLQQAAAETATPPETPPFQPPTVEELARLFPQLEIIALIGKGGMGAVYQARQPALDRIVALKILPARTEGGADFTERFNREARALARLNHPNIVTVHEFGQVNGLPFFLMEYVDGLNLRQLEQAGKLSPREALQIVPQICEALQFAHDAGIVHRDIKPDNILLDKKGRVKIADFGIAKIMGGPPDSAVPETQGAIGTPHYMAPEQVEKPQTVDHRADIFSLGVVFYEMLTGELPLGKFAPPSSGPRGMRVDVRLDEVVLRALEKEPDRRYQHASQVKTAVETIASTPPGAPPPPSPAPGPTPEALLARDYALDIGSCLHRGWALFKANFWPLAGMHALIWLLVLIADSAFSRIGHIGSEASGVNVSDGTSILGLVLAGPLWGGLFWYFLKTLRGEPVTVETAFAGFSKRFLHLFLVNLVSWFLIGLGFLCLILPGIYLLVAWSFALVLVMDKELEFWPAMELSRKMVHKHWWQIFALGLVLVGVWLLGVLGCCIGVLISAPVALAVSLYAYEDIFGKGTPAPPVAGQPLPPPPIAGAGAAKPAAAASPINPVNPPIQSDAAKSAGPAGPIGPTGTAVMPDAVIKPPASGNGIIFALLGCVVFVVVLLLVLFLVVARHIAQPPGLVFLQFVPMMLILAFVFLVVLAVMALVFVIRMSSAASRGVGGGRRFLKYLLLAVLGLLSLLLIAVLLLPILGRHMTHGNWSYSYSSSSHSGRMIQPVQPLQPLQPMQPLQPFASAPADQPADINTNDFNRLVERTRSELAKLPARFDTLHAAGVSDDTFFVVLSGLQVLEMVDGTNSWQNVTGMIQGTREGRTDKWVFAGQGQLAAVRFDIAQLDLNQVLAASWSLANGSPVTPENSHENLQARLEAAQTISQYDVKDRALRTLALKAAQTGDVELVKSALGQMSEYDQRDDATSEDALVLAQNGHRKEAVAIAEGISQYDVRDKTLAELAQ